MSDYNNDRLIELENALNNAVLDMEKIAQAVSHALRFAECEMRYAGWQYWDNENVGRLPAYEAVCRALELMK